MSVFIVGGLILCVVCLVALCFSVFWPSAEPAHDDGHCRGRVTAEEDSDDDVDDVASGEELTERLKAARFQVIINGRVSRDCDMLTMLHMIELDPTAGVLDFRTGVQRITLDCRCGLCPECAHRLAA